MAEQFALQQLARKTRTTDRDEWAIRLRTFLMKRPSEHAFACAAFAQNQNRRWRGRGFECEFVNLLHDRLDGFENRRRRFGGHARLQFGDFVFELARARDFGDGLLQLIGRVRLGQIVKRSLPHRCDRRFNRGKRRRHDHRQPRLRFEQLRHQLQAIFFAQPQIQQRHVKGFLFQLLHGAAAVRGGHDS